jgi:hypothetical protein
VETEGCPGDFTSSEVILGPILEQRGRWHSFPAGVIVLRVVKMPAQGFVEVGVPLVLSGPA